MNKLLLSFLFSIIFSHLCFGQFTYQWFKDGKELVGVTSESYKPVFTGKYSVKITNENNCSSEISNEFYFKCVAEKPTIKISNRFELSSSIDASSYKWFLDGIEIAQKDKTFKVTKGGKYALQIVNSNGCDSELSEFVSIVFIDTDSDGIEDSVDNCPKTFNSDQKDTDKDGLGDVCDDSDEDGVFDVVDICSNTLKGKEADKNGCSLDQKDSDQDGIFDDKDDCPTIKNPPIPIINKLTEIDLGSSSANAYQWFLDGKSIPSATTPFIKAINSGSYTVQIKDINGCISPISLPIVILITGLEEKVDSYIVYPNPTSEMVQFKFIEELPVKVQLVDIRGVFLKEFLLNSVNQFLNLSEFPSGVYYLNWLMKGNKHIFKIIKK